MKRGGRGLTLLELMIAIVVMVLVVGAVSVSMTYVLRQVSVLAERYTMYTQVAYAVDDIAAYTHACARVAEGSFFSSTGGSRSDFSFLGERDIFNVTPGNMAAKVTYRYYVDAASHDLVREVAAGRREVLVEGRYNPSVSFEYVAGDEPNVMVVKVNATSRRFASGGLARPVSKMVAVRFWFANIVQ